MKSLIGNVEFTSDCADGGRNKRASGEFSIPNALIGRKAIIQTLYLEPDELERICPECCKVNAKMFPTKSGSEKN